MIQLRVQMLAPVSAKGSWKQALAVRAVPSEVTISASRRFAAAVPNCLEWLPNFACHHEAGDADRKASVALHIATAIGRDLICGCGLRSLRARC
jgi:hypothetical protein